MAKVSVASEFAGLLLPNDAVEKRKNQRVSVPPRRDFSSILQDSATKASDSVADAVIDDTLIEQAMDDVLSWENGYGMITP